jgi:hypothetical protein
MCPHPVIRVLIVSGIRLREADVIVNGIYFDAWFMKLFAFVPPLVGFLLLSAVFVAQSMETNRPISDSQAAPQPVPMDQPLTEQNDALASLRRFLADENWQAVDQETRQLLDQWVYSGSDMFSTPLAGNISIETIQTIDQLWLGDGYRDILYADVSAGCPYVHWRAAE